MRARRIGFDRVLDTDRPIRGTLATSGHGSDVRIRWHPAVAVPAEEAPVWSREDGALCFVPPGVARYRCTSDNIDVTPFDGASPAMVEALLIATALPALLWLQGGFVLHAAAIVPRGEDRALAIAGASGSGKSRLAAAFVGNGGRLVADDSIAVRWEDGRAVCAGLAGGYHLGAPGQEERAFHVLPSKRVRRSAPLAAVVVLGDRASPVRLAGVEAVGALLANRHRASVPRLCGLEPRALADAVRLARTIPVFRWCREDADALLADDIRRAMMQDGEER